MEPSDFAVPYNQFPNIREALECVKRDGKTMEAALSRKMMRIIATDIHLKYPKPGRQFFNRIAMKYCEEYPALQVGASYIEQTYITFSHDLRTRVNNMNQGSSAKTPKRPGAGCVQFAPAMSRNDKVLQEEQLSGLKLLYQANVSANDCIKRKMVETYNAQRGIINTTNDKKRTSISDIKAKIPYLFNGDS